MGEYVGASEGCWVDGWMGGWVGGWVAARVCSWLWVFDVFRTFDFLTHGGFTTLSRPLLVLYVICRPAVIHGGWMDRFLGVTVVPRSAAMP